MFSTLSTVLSMYENHQVRIPSKKSVHDPRSESIEGRKACVHDSTKAQSRRASVSFSLRGMGTSIRDSSESSDYVVS